MSPSLTAVAPGTASWILFGLFFLLMFMRVPVAPVGDGAFAALLQLDDARPGALPEPITPEERAAVRTGQAAVALGDDTLAALTTAAAGR